MSDRIHGELCHQNRTVLIALGRPLQWHGLGERFICDQDTGGVGAYMVDDAFQPLCIIHKFCDGGFLLIGHF